MTAQQINEAVARKLGWIQCCNPGTMENGKIVDCLGWSKGGSHFHEGLPDFCHSIKAAWTAVEHLRSEGLQVVINADPWGGTTVMIYAKKEYECLAKEEEGPAPMAICLAFLKLP